MLEDAAHLAAGSMTKLLWLQTTELVSELASGSGGRLQCQQETHRQSSCASVMFKFLTLGVHSRCVVDEENLRPVNSRPSKDCIRLAGKTAAGACMMCCRHISFECIAAAGALACFDHEQHGQMPAQVAALEM